MTFIITADEFLKIGLKLVGYTKRRIRRCKKKTNVERFVAHFGSIPCVCACIWEDLQTTKNEEARVLVNDLNGVSESEYREDSSDDLGWKQ